MWNLGWGWSWRWGLEELGLCLKLWLGRAGGSFELGSVLAQGLRLRVLVRVGVGFGNCVGTRVMALKSWR